MTWAEIGVLWTISGVVPRSLGIIDQSLAAEPSQLTFLQISDSHVGSDKAANPHAISTLHGTIRKIKALPAEFDNADASISEAGLDVHDVPGEHEENPMSRAGAKLRVLLSLVVTLLVCSIAVGGPIVSMPGPVNIEGTQSRRQLWLVPSTDPSVLMRTTVFRPPGEGPFPLVVMNHGTAQDPVQRQYFPLLEFEAAALWFVEQGFVVAAPQRPGYGETGGIFLEGQANCAPSDFLNAGRAGAADIQRAIDYMTTQPFVLKNGIVVVGQSAGGWDTLALASQNPRMVRAGIDFEGGRGGHFRGKPTNNCQPDNLVAAARELGSTAQIPVLMIYTENDTFFGPALSKRLYEAWTEVGGIAEYHLLAPFKEDGHFLVDDPDSVPVWSPIVMKFLGRHRPNGFAAK